jgi:hypothetical protein
VTARARAEQRSTFVLKIEGKPGAAGIHALRGLLKILLRRYGFRAIDVREDVAPDVSNQIADVFTELRRNVSEDHITRKL